jgi:hypothetical protein
MLAIAKKGRKRGRVGKKGFPLQIAWGRTRSGDRETAFMDVAAARSPHPKQNGVISRFSRCLIHAACPGRLVVGAICQKVNAHAHEFMEAQDGQID